MLCVVPAANSVLFPGGHSWKWGGRQVLHDPEVLQGHLHQGLQEDDRSRLSRETHQVIVIMSLSMRKLG